MSGITVAGIGAGTMITPPVANWLISTYNWRTSFIIIGIAAFVLVAGLAQLLVRDPGRMGLSPYGASAVKDNKSSLDTAGLSLREAIRTRQLWTLFIIYICAGIVIQTIIVHIVIHARGLEISAASAAAGTDVTALRNYRCVTNLTCTSATTSEHLTVYNNSRTHTDSSINESQYAHPATITE